MSDFLKTKVVGDDDVNLLETNISGKGSVKDFRPRSERKSFRHVIFSVFLGGLSPQIDASFRSDRILDGHKCIGSTNNRNSGKKLHFVYVIFNRTQILFDLVDLWEKLWEKVMG